MSGAILVESKLDPAKALYREIVLAGDPWIREIKAGQIFRIVDLEGNQAADTLFYNAADHADRYSYQDTIREQGNIYLTTGTKLLSTDGHDVRARAENGRFTLHLADRGQQALALLRVLP